MHFNNNAGQDLFFNSVSICDVLQPRESASYMSQMGKKIDNASVKMNTPITTVIMGSSVAVNFKTLS